jgi:2,4-dienoyl-CoA reductase-like NADH-dependent reductase (Old Yellow Enzyme family)
MHIDLFRAVKIGHLELRNRFVRSATGDGSADEIGRVTQHSEAIYEKLGEGGVGLIITGHSFISIQGQASPNQYGIHDDKMIHGLRRLAKAAHQGGAKIAVQISHAGINSRLVTNKHNFLQAVSSLDGTPSHFDVMTDKDIRDVILQYVSASRRAVEAGFDAIQLHGAHGYLMSQFLSPLYNHREDDWGGSDKKRRAFHLEVVRSVRNVVGPDFPLFMKLGVRDEHEGGLSLEEGVETAQELSLEGLDAIEVSCGIGKPMKTAGDTQVKDAYFRKETEAVKGAVKIPVMIVGGVRSLELAEDIIDSNGADLISMCRPFIREPDLIQRWSLSSKSISSCVSCNTCSANRGSNKPFMCAREIEGSQ